MIPITMFMEGKYSQPFFYKSYSIVRCWFWPVTLFGDYSQAWSMTLPSWFAEWADDVVKNRYWLPFHYGVRYSCSFWCHWWYRRAMTRPVRFIQYQPIRLFIILLWKERVTISSRTVLQLTFRPVTRWYDCYVDILFGGGLLLYHLYSTVLSQWLMSVTFIVEWRGEEGND